MRQSDEPTDRERCEMEIIKSLMRSYFDIARKNFQVSQPRTIRSNGAEPRPGFLKLGVVSVVVLVSSVLSLSSINRGGRISGGRKTMPTTPC